MNAPTKSSLIASVKTLTAQVSELDAEIVRVQAIVDDGGTFYIRALEGNKSEHARVAAKLADATSVLVQLQQAEEARELAIQAKHANYRVSAIAR
jgi:hypothetical protein